MIKAILTNAGGQVMTHRVMFPKTTTKRTLRLLGVVMAAVLMASVAMSGSALAGTQASHQDGDIDQAQKNNQANFAKVNVGDQTNTNKQFQTAGIYQKSEQEQESEHTKKKRHKDRKHDRKKKDCKKKDRKKCKKHDRKHRDSQDSTQDADIDQSQRNAQANFAGLNTGDQTNRNLQGQQAFIGQTSEQEQE